ncbi:hypothetical protein Goshw_029209, partial [Gossypium schwendimanii]|nr:hypothetical protein [Gossypium schwendimanii]
AEESVQHVFSECPFTHQILQELNVLFLSSNRRQLENMGPNFYTWGPPSGDVMKANFDATFYQGTKSATTGILVRNNKGFVMAACTYPFEHDANSTMAEARACLRALIFMEELGF